VIELLADAVQPCNCFRRKHMGEIADVIGGLGKVFDALGQGGNAGNTNSCCQQQPEECGMSAAKALHRFLLYGFGEGKVPIAASCIPRH